MSDPKLPPRKKKKGCIIALIVAGILGLLGLLGLVALGGLFTWGLSEVNEQVADSLHGIPEISERFGEVESVEAKLWESGLHAQETGDPSVLIYELDGTKSDGKILVRTNNKTGEFDYLGIHEPDSSGNDSDGEKELSP